MFCSRCGQLLTNPESQARQMGPICALKSAAAISGGLATLGTTEAELDTLEPRTANLIIKALQSDHRRRMHDARHFLAVARSRRAQAQPIVLLAA